MQEKGMGVSDHRVYGYYGLTDLVKILDKTPGVGSLFDCQCRSIMRRTDRSIRPALSSWETIGLSPCQDSVVRVY